MTETDKIIRLMKVLDSCDGLRICTIYCAYGIPAMSLLDYGDLFLLRVHEVRYVM
jgi:Fe-S-cluster-containing dehydrogenase component